MIKFAIRNNEAFYRFICFYKTNTSNKKKKKVQNSNLMAFENPTKITPKLKRSIGCNNGNLKGKNS